jgi:MOSC domain-containing protein YiiM
MGKVHKIGLSKIKGGKIDSFNEVKATAGKGLVNDRKYKEENNIKSQITLIEIENINYYNKISKTNIRAIDFRRNIITSDINLNNLINKEFYIGEVKVKAHDLCRPCKYLEHLLKQKEFVKKLLKKGGLRCEILTSGNIYINDKISY